MPPSRSESAMAHGDVSGGSRALKRAVDVGASVVGLLLASPFLLVACASIWLEDRHSPFYVAARIGRRGRPFRMVKLRSMVVRADRTGVDSTAQGDPRITRVGRVLRRFKLDERSEEHTSELQSRLHLVCRLLLEKKKKKTPSRYRGYSRASPPATTRIYLSMYQPPSSATSHTRPHVLSHSHHSLHSWTRSQDSSL